MKEHQTTRSSLFLIELILAILFFSLASAVCVQVFVKAHFMSRSASELTMGANYAATAAEVLSQTDGSYKSIKKLLPEAQKDGEEIRLTYDQNGEPCPPEKAEYCLRIKQTDSAPLRTAQILFTDKKGICLYRLDPQIRIPRFAEN